MRNIYLLPLKKKTVTAMGRFICIGIIYQIRIEDSDSLTPEQLFPLFPKELFDYSLFSSGFIRVHDNTPASDIYNLRKDVMGICDLGGEPNYLQSDSEKQLHDALIKLDAQGLITLAVQGIFESFKHDRFPFSMNLHGAELNLTADCLYFWVSPYKFYPADDYAPTHEVNDWLNALIRHNLGNNKYKSLITSYITC